MWKVLCLSFAVSLPLTAQNPGAATAEPVGHLNPGFVAPPTIPPQMADRLAKHLGLDAAKTGQVKKIQSDLSLDLEKMKIGIERKMLDFRELLLGQNLDMDKIRRNCEERGRLMADMQVRMVVADSEVKKLLTTEQWTQYMQFRIMMMNRSARPDAPKAGDGRTADAKP